MTRISKRTDRQETVRESNGVTYNVCHHCGRAVRYPEGIHTRDGREIHVACYRAARAARVAA